MDNFKAQVKKSFSVCKNDIESLKVENGELRSKLSDQTNQIEDLKTKLKGLMYAIEILKGSDLSGVVSGKDFKDDVVSSNLRENQSFVQTNDDLGLQGSSRREDPYEELLKFKARINKKDMLKNKLIAMINEHGSLLSEVKFLFVKQQNYCSNATFYNYLKELELEKKIVIRRERNRNYIFLNDTVSGFKNDDSSLRENYYTSFKENM